MNPVVSAVLIMAFSVSIVALALNLGLPLIDEQKNDLEFQHGKNLVNSISTDISNLLDKPVNSSFQKKIEFSNGELELSNHTIEFTLGQRTYNRTFPYTQFSNLTLLSGKNNLTFTKTSIYFIEINK